MPLITFLVKYLFFTTFNTYVFCQLIVTACVVAPLAFILGPGGSGFDSRLLCCSRASGMSITRLSDSNPIAST